MTSFGNPRGGDLRHRITLQSRAAGQDAIGGQEPTWTDVQLVWAKIEPLSGREIMAAQAVRSEVTHRVVIRYQDSLSNPKAMAAMRILYGARIFNIQSATVIDERRAYIEIMASEGLNNG